MGRIIRSPRLTAGLEIVPPTLMIVTGHPWLGAATLASVLAVSALQSWIMVRSEEERHRATLSFAREATSMGNDPAPVIAAMRSGPAGEGGESPGADAEDRRRPPWFDRPPRT